MLCVGLTAEVHAACNCAWGLSRHGGGDTRDMSCAIGCQHVLVFTLRSVDVSDSV